MRVEGLPTRGIRLNRRAGEASWVGPCVGLEAERAGILGARAGGTGDWGGGGLARRPAALHLEVKEREVSAHS